MGDPSGVVNQNDKISKVEESAVRGEVHRRLLCELLLDFARNSTLHGPRYLTARGLHVIERIFWGVTFVTIYLFQIPFPAVTICQRTKVNQYKFNYTKHYISFKKYMRELKSNYSGEELKNREQVYVYKTIKNIAASFEMFNGTWENTSIGRRFHEAFAPVLMKEGICFTFNTLASDEIFHMHRKVYLHHPADLPQSSRSYYTVQDSNVVHFSIKVNLVTTSDTLINYAPHIRQCYFPSERTLHFFKMYTQKNCRLECLTNYTLKSCGCVPHYMPRKLFIIDYSTADDGFGNINDTRCQCLPLCHSVQYEAEVARTRVLNQFHLLKISSNEFYTHTHARTRARTHARIHARMHARIHFTAVYLTRRSGLPYRFAQISMNYKESHFTSLRRSELFGATDFLANCGGLLGLFLGFSFLSLVEIFYFFTLR
ncbi:pickpocket protein 28-like [Cydia pomonella]|uniref:pickpocket protein 28-like n=1 Tax=Cydia pomonella TaxID=82600 RepID=UPI002ADE0CF5|nr:pickpocket protein 28-like [Cydia pomonella]